MLGIPNRQWIDMNLARTRRLWLFLDYDGTLADLAPTPEHVNPDPAVVDLLTGLVRHPTIRVAVISGRRLSHVETLVPVPGVLLAGTYGIELRTPEGKRVSRVDFDAIRPPLEVLKPQWLKLIARHESFFLEDKGWALALHGRYADEEGAKRVLTEAREVAAETVQDTSLGSFRLLGGHKFLEIGPMLAHKGKTVDYLLNHYPWPGALPLYLGDDDKDEEAFDVIKSRGGIAMLVASGPRSTKADCRLASPRAVRGLLRTLSIRLNLLAWKNKHIHQL